MKKIIYTTALSLAVLSGVATTVLLNNANAETSNPNTLESLTDSTTLATSLPASKNETVYVITDSAGIPTKIFLGNVLETSKSDLPVELKITYFLDGNEISAADLASKSGHVKVTYAYTSTKTYQNKLIPFLTLTGLQLDSNKFTNLKIENGKIISEGDNTMIAGYAFAGLNNDLNTDLVPDSFTIEADVTDFSLETTYTLATNEIFTDLDTSKLSTVDELISSMGQLDSGINQILSGATDLSNGLNSALAGANQLYDGAKALSNGMAELSTGATKLSDNLNCLTTTYNPELQAGATAIIESTIASLHAQDINVTVENYEAVLSQIIPTLTNEEQIAALTQALGLLKLSTGIIGYTDGVGQLAAGASSLTDSVTKLQAGSTELVNGLGTLVAGETELYNGSVTLKDGITTFKTDGIDKLVNFAQNDLSGFTNNFRSTVNAAKSYHSYKSTSAESVKFIFKTPSIQ